MISEGYRELNRELHTSHDSYGTSGRLYAESVLRLSDLLATRDILDYGCGKRTLEQALGFPINNYDPCVEGYEARPEPADLVVCTDVLEHIEPDHLSDVLDDLARLTKRVIYASIHTTPAGKLLGDGRNAHLLVKHRAWWLLKLSKRFLPLETWGVTDGFVFVGKRIGSLT